MTATSAARELRYKIWDFIWCDGEAAQDDPHWDDDEIEALITAALKLCRNEALEEAALEVGQMDEGLWTDVYADAIRELKEAE